MTESILQYTTRFILFFSTTVILLPVVIVGFIWVDRKLFYHAICLILLSIIINYALKITFQIPLSPLLGKKGFAFPSGHMQSSIVLYGWIAYNRQHRVLRWLILLLLVSIGLSLVYWGYHTYYDILGAIFFAFLLMLVYAKTLFYIGRGQRSFLFCIATILLLYIRCRYRYEIETHAKAAYCMLIGFTASTALFNNNRKNNLPTTAAQKIAATLLCCGSIYFIHLAFHYLNFPLYLLPLRGLIIGFIVPFSTYASSILIKEHT